MSGIGGGFGRRLLTPIWVGTAGLLAAGAAVATILDLGPNSVPFWLFFLVLVLLIASIDGIRRIANVRQNDRELIATLGRRYELYENSWTYSRSQIDSSMWDAVNTCTREIVALSDGVDHVSYSMRLAEDDETKAFSRERPPEATLVEARRRAGGVELADPHKSSGSAFAFRVYFRPALAPGEDVHLKYRVLAPNIKFATREQVIEATKYVLAREHEQTSTRSTFPARRLIVSAFLPDDLNATPTGPRVTVAGARIPAEEARIADEGFYRERRTEVDGDSGIELRLEVEQPHVGVSYSITWIPPWGTRQSADLQ